MPSAKQLCDIKSTKLPLTKQTMNVMVLKNFKIRVHALLKITLGVPHVWPMLTQALESQVWH